MESAVRRCLNCSLRLRHLPLRSLCDVNDNIYNLLAAWIAPTPISHDGVVCTECYATLRTALQAGQVSAPVLGHKSVCYGCGISILRKHTSRVPLNCEERNIIITGMPPHLVPHLQRVCRACLRAVKRTVHRHLQQNANTGVTPDQQDNPVQVLEPPPQKKLYQPQRQQEEPKIISHIYKDGTEDSITSPGVSQHDEVKLTEREAPQTSKDAPMEVIECTYSSSTESAPSDTDNLPLKTYKEQKRMENDDKPKSRSELAAVESTAAVQYSELNRTEKMELDDEVQSRVNKPVRVRKQKRPVKMNTQTSAEAQRTEETIEQYKVYTIIANVYNYLSKEYELLKSQLGKRCDLSSLANILQRTAAATGVTQRTVTAALDTYKLKTIRSDHSYIVENTRTNTARSKSKKAGSSANVCRKGRTKRYKRLTNKQQEDESDGEELRPLKRKTSSDSIKSKPTNEDQLPEDHDSEGEGVRPPKRRSARNNDRITLNNEEQLPFPSPIQFRVPGVMETEIKAEPADECQQTLENDPLGPVSQFPIHCTTPEATTKTVFKAEPADDEWLQKPETDPLETETSPAALEEPSDPSDDDDPSKIEMKFESVDEEYADLCTDYSICNSAFLDIKPEPPSE